VVDNDSAVMTVNPGIVVFPVMPPEIYVLADECDDGSETIVPIPVLIVEVLVSEDNASVESETVFPVLLSMV